MAPRSADATPAITRPATRVGNAPMRGIKSDPGSAAIANRIVGRPERRPTSVPDRRRSDWMSAMTGGTARTVSRRFTPASHSRLPAIQISRMALPAAAFAVLCSELEHVRLCLKHADAAYSVRSPPPCGEGLGVGVHRRLTARPPPRRFAIADASHRRSWHQGRRPKAAYALPTRGRVKTEFAAGADFPRASTPTPRL